MPVLLKPGGRRPQQITEWDEYMCGLSAGVLTLILWLGGFGMLYSKLEKINSAHWAYLWFFFGGPLSGIFAVAVLGSFGCTSSDYASNDCEIDYDIRGPHGYCEEQYSSPIEESEE